MQSVWTLARWGTGNMIQDFTDELVMSLSEFQWLYIISQAVRREEFGTILKYHEYYLCQISHTNQGIIF